MVFEDIIVNIIVILFFWGVFGVSLIHKEFVSITSREYSKRAETKDKQLTISREKNVDVTFDFWKNRS